MDGPTYGRTDSPYSTGLRLLRFPPEPLSKKTNKFGTSNLTPSHELGSERTSERCVQTSEWCERMNEQTKE